jgi:uroporphyrinogen decarboxylase
VRAALALEVADRPPVSAWGHFYDREWEVASLAGATVAAARRHRFDFVKLQVRASCFAEAFGAGWSYSGSAAEEPIMTRAGGATVEDWRRIVEGPFDPAPLFDQVAVLRTVTAELGPEVPVIQTVFSPGMVAWFLAGRDTARLSGLVATEPELMAAGLETVAGALARFTADSLEAGAAGVFYAVNPLADTTVVSTEEYRRSYLPADRRAAAAARDGWFNMLHLCGGHINLEIASELHLSCLNWAAEEPGNPALAEARDGLRVAVAGGVGRYSPIRVEDPAEMRRAAEAALAETGRRGHLLTPGCSTSPWSQVRPAVLDALVGAA